MTSAALPSVTLSAIPPASTWSVPISVGMDKLRPYTAYVFEVSAFTSDGEGQIASTMVRMPEAAPQDSPQNLSVWNITSKSLFLSWEPPTIITGRFTYVVQLYGPAGLISENSTSEQMFMYTGLTPYTRYRMVVMAKSAGSTGPAAENSISTPSEVLPAAEEIMDLSSDHISYMVKRLSPFTEYNFSVSAYTTVGEGPSTLITEKTTEQVPSSVQDVSYQNISSTSVLVSWSPPLNPNGKITHYTVYLLNLHSHEAQQQMTNATSIVLRGLDKYTRYKLRVAASTAVGESPLSVEDDVYILTPEDGNEKMLIMLMSFFLISTFINIILFSLSNTHYLAVVNTTSSTATITWSPPDKPNGIIRLYEIFYSNATYSHTVNSTVSSVTLRNLKPYSHYNVSVQAYTLLGNGDQTSPTLQMIGPVHNLSAQLYGSTAVVISWDPPLEPNGRVFYQLSLLEAGITHPSINRTENRTITKTTTDTVFLFTKLRKYFPYVLYVTPATSAGSALNHTSVLHLRTDDDIPSSPPVHSMSRNLSATSVLVSWYSPVETNGEIIEYALVLNGPKGSNSSYTPDTYFILMYLTPYTSYNLSISAVNRRGMGPSLMLALHTDEAGPMSPPRNLSIFNHSSDSVWLHWEPSLEPNGLIQHYGFRIVELNTNTVTYQNSSDASTQAELSGFKPHSSYEISVCTYTRVGNGDQYSLPVTFTTNESVSEAVGNLSCSGLDWDSVYMEWEPPVNPNGEILLYLIRSEEFNEEVYPLTLPDTEILTHTFSGLKPDSFYVISVAAVNSEGPGEEANCTAHTPPESVPGPPQNLSVFNTSSNAVTLSWLRPARVPGLLRGYRVERQRLSQACEAGEDLSCVESEIVMSVKGTGDQEMVTLQSLLKFRRYRIRVVALTNAGAGEPTEWIYVQTLAGSMLTSYAHILYRISKFNNVFCVILLLEPKDPPKNLTLTVIPEEVTRVYVTFLPPDEPNGNISAYRVSIYRDGQLDFHLNINSQSVISNPNKTMTAVIDGLKGGFNYSIRVKSFILHIFRPKHTNTHAGVQTSLCAIMATSKTITIEMPECFFSDDNGPIRKIQVIISEPAVMDYNNVSNWKSVFLHPPAPYFTDEGFPNPECREGLNRGETQSGTYIIGADDCFSEEAQTLCNGPLKPRTYYVFKFRATNILGQYTDSAYSDRVRTAGKAGFLQGHETTVLSFIMSYFIMLLSQIILGVLLSFFLALIHQRKMEGGTYSPREAEIIETKLKLDQLIAVADMELKEEKINRLLSYRKSLKPISKKAFLQHVEDLCANDNAKFHEEFAVSVWKNVYRNVCFSCLLSLSCRILGTSKWQLYITYKAHFRLGLMHMNIYLSLCPSLTFLFLTLVSKHGDYMVVHHFNYTSWPEHGVPESSSTLIQFVKAVRSNRGHDNTTIVVHCSAGVGRTGVFIALDHLIQHVRDHDFVDVYGLVAELRSERMCMVQNLAQYMFLYQSTLDLLTSKGNSQSIWFVNYSALEKMDSLDAMEGLVMQVPWHSTYVN
uniref:Protein tyrosine phosphatase receptor type Q n=1 Tax=Astyanax mexicanus TaxID=7994 RepID=A0A8B9GYK0_ASTMX